MFNKLGTFAIKKLALGVCACILGIGAQLPAFADDWTKLDTGFMPKNVDQGFNNPGTGGAGIDFTGASNGFVIVRDNTDPRGYHWASVSGTGTVTAFSVASLPSWLTSSVATANTTPALTIVSASALTSHQVLGTFAGSTIALGSLAVADLPTITAGIGGTGSTTVPTSGQIPVGNAGGTAYAPQTVTSDGTLDNAGHLIVTKTNGSAFVASATIDTTNAANISSGILPPARGGTGSGTAPTSGQVNVGNAGGTASVPQTLGGDIASVSAAGAVVVTKTNGVAFAASATTDATNAANISSGILSPARGGTGVGTVPTAGQIPIGNAGGTAYAPLTPTGDVTFNSSGVDVIGNSAVTNAKMASMSAHTYKGNNTGSTAAPADVTSTQLTADLNAFTSSLQGMVPASGGGTTNFLRADGTFAAPSGGGGMTNPMTTPEDIIKGTTAGAPVRLGIGTPTQVLGVDSSSHANYIDFSMEPTLRGQVRKHIIYAFVQDDAGTARFNGIGQATGASNFTYEALTGSSGMIHASSPDSNGMFEQYTTTVTSPASGQNAGIGSVSDDEIQYQTSPKVWFHWETGAAITNTRMYFGVGRNTTDVINNNGSTNGVGAWIRYDSALDGTTWHLITMDGSGTVTSTDTGVTVTTSSDFYGCLDLASSASSIGCSVNGSVLVTSSTHLPPGSTNLGPFALVETLTSAQRSIKLSSIIMTQK